MSVQTTTTKNARREIERAKPGTLSVVFCGLPTCGHCSVMKPIYRELASEFQCCSEVHMYEVDFSRETDRGAEFARYTKKPAPTGFPTFYLFDGASFKAMRQGSCTKEAFRMWMIEQGLNCSMCTTGTR